MKRLLIPALILLALVAAGCGSDEESNAAAVAVDEAGNPLPSDGTPATGVDITSAGDAVAISVNGETITVDAFREHLDAWAQQSETVGQSPLIDGLYDPNFVSGITQQYIQFEAFLDQLDSEGIEVTDANRESAKEEIATDLPTFEAGSPIYEQLVGWLAGLDSVAPTDEEIQAYYDENPDEFEQVCASHILFGTEDPNATPPAAGEPPAEPTPEAIASAEADAEAAKARIDAGEDFAALATELSTGPSGPEGGDLGCAGRGSYVPEFEEAAFGATPGEVTDPILTDFGYHLILVSEFRQQPLEEAKPLIEQTLGTQVNDILQAGMTAADVEIAPDFGSWDNETKVYKPIGA